MPKAKKKSRSAKFTPVSRFKFNQRRALLIVAFFAIIGGIFIYRSFAAPTKFVRGIALARSGNGGYWQVDYVGKVWSYGDTKLAGDASATGIKNVVGMAGVRNDSYYIANADGRVFAYGTHAKHYGDVVTRKLRLAAGISGIATTNTGAGYWLVDRQGGVLAFGDAPFKGSLPSLKITPFQPIVGITPTPTGRGYWLVGEDGGVFAFGDAVYKGSLISKKIKPSAPIADIQSNRTNDGYYLLGKDGAIYALGSAVFHGSVFGKFPSDAVSLAAVNTGYWVTAGTGQVAVFGSADRFLENLPVKPTPPPPTPKPTPQPPTPTPPTPKTPVSNATKVPCYGNGSDGNRIQVVYAYHEGKPDRLSASLVEKIKKDTHTMNGRVLLSAVQSGGIRQLRFVHDGNCEVTIQKLRLPASLNGASTRTFVDTVFNLGLRDPFRKYLIYWDTTTAFCGIAYQNRNENPDPKLNPVAYEAGWAIMAPSCWGPIRSVGDKYANTDVALHELVHTFGAVNNSSPHHTGHSHCWDDQDVMCYDDDGSGPVKLNPHVCPSEVDNLLLDCHDDDYFDVNPPPGSYLATHWNSANSPWLNTQ